MMSINLYRGKRKDNGEWVYGLPYYRYDSFFGEYRLHIQRIKPKVDFEIDPETVGQSTGHNDLFTGDIIKSTSDNEIGVIRSGSYCSPFRSNDEECHIGFYVDWIKEESYLRKDLGYWIKKTDFIKIGNIHDNPKLLGFPDQSAEEKE